MSLFSPTASLVRRCVLGGTALFLLSLPLGAATPAAPAAKPTPAPPKAEETVFFTVQAGHHSVLCRSDSDGACKVYLGPLGQGWQAYPDPSQNGDDLAAASAPDGKQFALISSRGGSVNLYLISADGLKSAALTRDDVGILAPASASKDSLAFSPDGKTLAYIDRGNLWAVGVTDGQARSLTFDGGIRALCWSPSGDYLAVVQNTSLRRISFNGSSDVVLVANQCTQPLVAWSQDAQTPKDVYFFSSGAQRVDESLNTDMVLPSSIQPNSLALLPKGVALIAPAAAKAQPEVFMLGFTDKAVPEQITLGGASAVWASPNGKSLYFMRDHVLWHCGLDGSQAKPLGAVPMAHISLGALLPLVGACR